LSEKPTPDVSASPLTETDQLTPAPERIQSHQQGFRLKTRRNTKNTTPAHAISINLEANKIQKSKNTAAEIPDNLPHPQKFILIILWLITAHPPIVPKKPESTFAIPWLRHPLRLFPWVRLIRLLKLGSSGIPADQQWQVS